MRPWHKPRKATLTPGRSGSLTEDVKTQSHRCEERLGHGWPTMCPADPTDACGDNKVGARLQEAPQPDPRRPPLLWTTYSSGPPPAQRPVFRTRPPSAKPVKQEMNPDPPPRHLPNPHPATETPYINEGRIPETASSGQCLTEPPAPQSSFRSYVVSGSEVTTPATARLVTGPGHRAWQL